MILNLRTQLTFFFILIITSSASAIEKNQVNKFQSGNTENWVTGSPNPTSPEVIASGGPEGECDGYLLTKSSGQFGPGGKLVIFNLSEWTGDYIAADVNSISMHVRNYGTTDISLRIVLRGNGGDFWPVNPIIIPAQGSWITASFKLDAANLTGGSDLNLTLSSVSEVRILHSISGGYIGEPILASLGIDNITAADNPLAAGVVSVSGDHQNFKFALAQNYPNPFNPSTWIKYTIEKEGLVTIKIFDILGKEVKELIHQYQNSGTYSINFDASGLSSGIYVYQINSGSFQSSKKMTLTK